MTTFERRQPESVFIHAGRTAFLLDIPRANNPYKKDQPYADLWDAGFQQAQKEYDESRQPRERVERPLAKRATGTVGAQSGRFNSKRPNVANKPKERPQSGLRVQGNTNFRVEKPAARPGRRDAVRP